MNTKKISILFSSSFGIGNLKFFPGTLASFATLPMVWFIKDFFSFNLFLIILILYSVISYFLIKICIKNLTNKDPKYIVADEHIGQSISLIFCDQKILDYLIAFILFRFFDILKPFPINLVDKHIKNACGVIFDDVIAGVYVCLMIIYVF
ncbi:MAG: phosphatidylglycerophosphatase [Rickettsiales bacterium]|nr:phosphatidylglycerophosphatase [Rickettsiales bacterium]|tara:strand:+ start:99 stop:548 length:450 start_codon:yes stop_codon:yes gene_type:complete